MKKIKIGLKFDNNKSPLELIPYEALDEIGKVLAAGAKKYKRFNWTNGINYSRLIGAALRHINQFNSGEDKDNETNTNHIANAICNLMFILYFEKHRKDLDDRGFKLFLKRKKYEKK